MNKPQTYAPDLSAPMKSGKYKGKNIPIMFKADKGQWVSRRAYNKLLRELREAQRYSVILHP